MEKSRDESTILSDLAKSSSISCSCCRRDAVSLNLAGIQSIQGFSQVSDYEYRELIRSISEPDKLISGWIGPSFMYAVFATAVVAAVARWSSS